MWSVGQRGSVSSTACERKQLKGKRGLWFKKAHLAEVNVCTRVLQKLLGHYFIVYPNNMQMSNRQGSLFFNGHWLPVGYMITDMTDII